MTDTNRLKGALARLARLDAGAYEIMQFEMRALREDAVAAFSAVHRTGSAEWWAGRVFALDDLAKIMREARGGNDK